jgi:hypothetical protein
VSSAPGCVREGLLVSHSYERDDDDVASGIGSDIQRPLATVIVGGLLSTLPLTLLVLPSLYGRWHSIRVEVRNGRYRIRARRGYVAS